LDFGLWSLVFGLCPSSMVSCERPAKQQLTKTKDQRPKT
jgi:hypothetical protein